MCINSGVECEMSQSGECHLKDVQRASPSRRVPRITERQSTEMAVTDEGMNVVWLPRVT